MSRVKYANRTKDELLHAEQKGALDAARAEVRQTRRVLVRHIGELQDEITRLRQQIERVRPEKS